MTAPMNQVGPGMPSTVSLWFAAQSGVNSPSSVSVPFANMWSRRAIMRVVWSSEKSAVKLLSLSTV